MKTKYLRLIALISGIAAFDFLFYKQAPGFNVLLFTMVLYFLILLSGRKPLRSGRIRIAAVGLLFSGSAVALYASDWSLLAYMGAFMVYLGFIFDPELRVVISAIFRAGLNFLAAPARLFAELTETNSGKNPMSRLLKYGKLLLIPILALFVFTTIYRFADPHFNDYFLKLDRWISQFFKWSEQYFSMGHLIFLFFTSVMICGIIYQGNILIVNQMEKQFSDPLIRIKNRPAFRRSDWKSTALKDEYRMGMLLFALLNALLLLVNTTGLFWLKGEFNMASAPAMSQNLHEGTGLLILSIVLSMIVVLLFFRKNLNFYPGNKLLIISALLWIAQNGLMALNVAARNWYYVSHYGLTYKRIGVLFFLLMVITGLALMWVKVKNMKSTFFLLRTNAWSFYFAFILFAVINWDQAIVSFNMQLLKTSSEDIQTILNLPDRTLQTIDQNRNLIFRPGKEQTEVMNRLDKRIQDFTKRQSNMPWISINYSDRAVYNYFLEKPLKKK